LATAWWWPSSADPRCRALAKSISRVYPSGSGPIGRRKTIHQQMMRF
jgi:hypothetical protein